MAKADDAWTYIVRRDRQYVVALVVYENGKKVIRYSPSAYDAAQMGAAEAALLARRIGGWAVHFNPITGALETV